ncbi:MAG: hypothetical protein H6713_22715 [Myxococcales bacterium]|nr:hypothetical protein [Myxococcales bacterium]
MSGSEVDAHYMGMALRLAREGTGSTYPNPCVGAVVVHDGQVVGAARSAPTGGPHAGGRGARAGGGARARVHGLRDP